MAKNKKKIYCQSCETTFKIKILESNYENLNDIIIEYCPICSSNLNDFDDENCIEDYEDE